jgi:hypothetical protein
VPGRNINRSLTARFVEVAFCGIDKARTSVCLSLQVRFHAGYFSIESALRILLAKRRESKKNPYTTMFFVDDSPTAAIDSDTGRTSARHEVPPDYHL